MPHEFLRDARLNTGQGKAPRLTVSVTKKEQLTVLPQIPFLKAEFSLRDRPVKDLWRVDLKFVNTGSATLIGDGTRKNIFSDHIPIYIGAGFDLIDLVSEDKGFGAVIQKGIGNSLNLRFLQWRNGESMTATLYLERTNGTVSTGTNLFSAPRAIIDGDLEFIDASNEVGSKPLVDYLPAGLATFVRLLIYGIAALVMVGAIAAGISTTKEFFRDRQQLLWQRNYLSKAKAHLQGRLSKSELELLLGGYRMSNAENQKKFEEAWRGFDGPMPDSHRWLNAKFPKPVADFALGSLVAIGLAIVAAALVGTTFIG